MKSEFYAEIVQMTVDAQSALRGFSAGGDSGAIFTALRSVGVACLDGEKINAGILEDLGPRQTMPFRAAVMKLAGLMTLSGGRGNNVSVEDALYNIKGIATELLDKAKMKEQGASDVHNPTIKSERDSYVSASRISELCSLVNPKWDIKKLTRLLEELNVAHAADCHMATAMLVRAIVDHVPPIFGLLNFGEVASNYAGGKSFKGSMKHLQESLRHIADAHLHAQIRKSEVLPTAHQVDFRNDLDVLIGEVIRVIRTPT